MEKANKQRHLVLQEPRCIFLDDREPEGKANQLSQEMLGLDVYLQSMSRTKPKLA